MDDSNKTPGGGPEKNKKGSLFATWGLRILLAVLLALIVSVISIAVLIVIASQNLPHLSSLDDYNPRQSTHVYGGQHLIGRFATEHRIVVKFERIPQIMRDAVLAAEDSSFYQHQGVDFIGISRCVVINIMSGRSRCGGSTITQQTVKTFFLSPERSLTRKVREVLLAYRVEAALTKDEILFLYLNQIYFGHRAYGVQTAAQIYFGKDISDVNVAEAALLAGLPQQPSRIDPFRNPKGALKRRKYVLGRLLALEKIDQKTYDEANNSPINLNWDKRNEEHLDNSSHYISHLRQSLAAMPEIGEQKLFEGGLRIYTGFDPKLQKAAENSLRRGLEALDKRQGWRGPVLHLDGPKQKKLVELLDKGRTKFQTKRRKYKEINSAAPAEYDEELVWDLSRLSEAPRNVGPEELVKYAAYRLFRVGKTLGGIVTSVSNAKRKAIVALGAGIEVELNRTSIRWARPFNINRYTSRPSRMSKVLSVGDIVLVSVDAPSGKKGQEKLYKGTLQQKPLVQSALVIIDPSSRDVKALVGGYGSGAGTYNRAIQARRQPGSTFKPFVYAAAFETREYDPTTICLDAPRVYRDPYAGRSWKPKNYGNRFDGEITLRKALTNSKNLCSVELIDKIGVDKVLSMAKRLGVESPLPRNLTLALGSGDVTPLEIVNGYASIADEGRYRAPVFIQKIVGPGAETIYENKTTAKQVVTPEVAYQITSLMQSVVDDGTAQRVKSLQRPVAGKTGTTNKSRNAWFIGFTPNFAAGVWVGFDDNRSLGPDETGGRAAIPIWLETAKAAVEGIEPLEFVAPPGIVFASVDPKTRKLVPPNQLGARTEPFQIGTEPTEIQDSQEPDIDPRDIFSE